MNKKNIQSYIDRKKNLLEAIKFKYNNKKGVILLFADFEDNKYKFRQNSTFYYFTGLVEPAVVLLIDFFGNQNIYIPNYKEDRIKWSSTILIDLDNKFKNFGFNSISYLSNEYKSNKFGYLLESANYSNLINILKNYIENNVYIFTNLAQNRLLINQLSFFITELQNYIIDITDIIAEFRKIKDLNELEYIYDAVSCTIEAQEMAANFIEPNKYEFEIQANIDFIFTQSNALHAFAPIIASGKNGLILHYTENANKIKKDDLVIVDIGAQIDYYCSDISRTYPSSGVFSKKQKEIYNIVLDTQKYIESIAAPGYWLNNPNEKEKSLHHLAIKFLDKYGYGKYFIHSIGHYLGLDVHDAGSYLEPLCENTVFTIEPGLYLKEENIAIRIEDDYYLSDKELICLSQDLVKEPEAIEELMCCDDNIEDLELTQN